MKTKLSRITTLIIVLSVALSCMPISAFATDVVTDSATDIHVSHVSLEAHSGVYISVDTSDPGIDPQYVIGSDSSQVIGAWYFRVGIHTISVNCSTGFNVDVYMYHNGSYWAGKTLSSAVGWYSWSPYITDEGYYTIYVYNNANSSVDLTLSIS